MLNHLLMVAGAKVGLSQIIYAIIRQNMIYIIFLQQKRKTIKIS